MSVAEESVERSKRANRRSLTTIGVEETSIPRFGRADAAIFSARLLVVAFRRSAAAAVDPRERLLRL